MNQVPTGFEELVGGVLVALAALLAMDGFGLRASLRTWGELALGPARRALREGRLPTARERLRVAVAAGLVATAIGWAVSGRAAALGLAGLAMPLAAVATARGARGYRRSVERGMPAVARGVADCLSAGHSVRGALRAVAASLDGPAGQEMARVGDGIDVGLPTVTVVEGFASRFDSDRIDAFASAVISQRTVGGDLATLLRRFADGVEEADRVADDARAATAQARFTGYLVVAMPIGAVLFGEVVSPGVLRSVSESGPALLICGLSAGMQAVAFMLISRIASRATDS